MLGRYISSHILFHYEFLLPPNSFANSKVFLIISKQILLYKIHFPSRLNQELPIFLFIGADINGIFGLIPNITFCSSAYTEDCHSSTTVFGSAVLWNT